jgi:hypothetical protein
MCDVFFFIFMAESCVKMLMLAASRNGCSRYSIPAFTFNKSGV